MYVPIHARGQDGFAQTAREGGSDPTNFWAAESRTMWGRSRPTDVLAACMFHVPPCRICRCVKSLGSGFGDVWAENRSETTRTCQSSPQRFAEFPKTVSCP